MEATRRITATSPCPILVVTGSVSDRPGLVYEALGHGAIDAISLPNLHEPAALAGEALPRRIRQIELISRPSGAIGPEWPPPGPAGLRPAFVASGPPPGGPRAPADALASPPARLPADAGVAQDHPVRF